MLEDRFFSVYPLVNTVIRTLLTEVFFCPRGKFGFISSFFENPEKTEEGPAVPLVWSHRVYSGGEVDDGVCLLGQPGRE